MNLDKLVATALARKERNLYGDLGPRCPKCSGLGEYLVLGGEHGVTKSGTRCGCDGSGLDIMAIERMDRELLWEQIHNLESKMGLPLSSRYHYPSIKMSRQYWMECIAWATADGTPVANSVVETILFPNVTIPGNYMQDGRCLRGYANFKWSTTTGTVTHVYQIRWGGVSGSTLCKTGTVTLLVSITNGFGEIYFELQTRSNGATGTIMANGHSKTFAATAPTIGSATGAPAVSPMTVGGQTAPAVASSTDLTADSALSITLLHGAASASNTATGLQYSLDSKN